MPVACHLQRLVSLFLAWRKCKPWASRTQKTGNKETNRNIKQQWNETGHAKEQKERRTPLLCGEVKPFFLFCCLKLNLYIIFSLFYSFPAFAAFAPRVFFSHVLCFSFFSTGLSSLMISKTHCGLVDRSKTFSCLNLFQGVFPGVSSKNYPNLRELSKLSTGCSTISHACSNLLWNENGSAKFALWNDVRPCFWRLRCSKSVLARPPLPQPTRQKINSFILILEDDNGLDLFLLRQSFEKHIINWSYIINYLENKALFLNFIRF